MAIRADERTVRVDARKLTYSTRGAGVQNSAQCARVLLDNQIYRERDFSGCARISTLDSRGTQIPPGERDCENAYCTAYGEGPGAEVQS